MIIKVKELNSEIIETAVYHADVGDLFIAFKKGTVYRYWEVPLKTVLKFLEAESKGSFFHSNIKNSFSFEKVK